MYGLCSVLECWEVYEAQHSHTECPKCGISRAEIIEFKTNDLNAIKRKKIDKEIEELYNDALGG